MRHFLIGLATLLAATSVGDAQPALVAPQPPADARPSSYVTGGFEAGANDGYLDAGGLVEAGTRVNDHVWLHGIVTRGGTEKLFSSGSGWFGQARFGADVVSCHAGGVMCAFVGADLGVQHVQYDGTEGSLFDNGGDSMPVSYNRTRMIGVGRVGLDVGGTHVRWRPGLEIAMASTGGNGFNLIQSLAYRF